MAGWVSGRVERFRVFEGQASYKYDIPVLVKLTGKKVTLDYSPDGVEIIYKGRRIGHGSYRLFRKGGGGSGTLHKVPDRNLLEGFWDEDGARGTWRIHL